LTAAKNDQSASNENLVGPEKNLSAIRSFSTVAIFLVVTIVGLAGDLASKHYTFKYMLDDSQLHRRINNLQIAYPEQNISTEDILHDHKLRPARQVMPGVKFTLSTNPGVVFGLPMPRWAVGLATIAAVGLVLLFFVTTEAKAKMLHIALAMILSGALGNLYDRLLGRVSVAGLEPIRYQVRDFIDCSQLHYPYIFNVADILLVFGAGLLILQWWFSRPIEKKSKS